MADVNEGDVVNAKPDAESGWFAVARKHRLFNGDLQLSDYQADKTISGLDFDLVGVQFASDTEVPEQPPVPQKFLHFNDGSEAPRQEPDEPAEDEAAENGESAAATGPESQQPAGPALSSAGATAGA